MSIIVKDEYGAPVIVDRNQIYFLTQKNSETQDSFKYIFILDIDEARNTITYVENEPFFFEDEVEEFISGIEEDEEDSIENYIIIDQSEGENIKKFIFDKNTVTEGDLQELLKDWYWELETDPRIPKCISDDFFTNFVHFPHKFYVFGKDQWNYILINKRPPYLSEEYELNMNDIVCLDDNLEGEWLKNNSSTLLDFEILKLEEWSPDPLMVSRRKLLGPNQKFYTTGVDSCLLVVIYDPGSEKKIVWHTTTLGSENKQKWYSEHVELKKIKLTIDTLDWNKNNLIVHFTRNANNTAGSTVEQNNVVNWILEFMDIPRTNNVKLFENINGSVGYDLCPSDPKEYLKSGKAFGGLAEEVQINF